MKTQIGLYVDVGTAERLRERARTVGASIGDLADLLMRHGLERLSEEALKTWALSLPSVQGRNAGQMTKDERAVAAAFGALPHTPGNEGAWQFSLSDISAEAGVRLTAAFWALKKLQARGLVFGHGYSDNEVDRWGRPLQSFWSLISAMPERARPRKA